MPLCALIYSHVDASATAGVRVYALWNRDIRMFCIVLLSGMFPAFTNFVSLYLGTSWVSIRTRCVQFFRGASAAYIIPTNLYSCQSAPWAMSASLYKECEAERGLQHIFAILMKPSNSVDSDPIDCYFIGRLGRRVNLAQDVSSICPDPQAQVSNQLLHSSPARW